MNVFPAYIIQTKDHFLLGTEWQYSKGTKPQEQEAWEFEKMTMESFLEEHGR